MKDAASKEASRSAGELSRMVAEGRSFSGHERNCCFLNTGNSPAARGRFANISAVSGLDFPDDGRAVALVDWDRDGDLDMWISNRNAPRLRLMRNDTPRGNRFLALRLQGNGTTTNRDAIGARVEVVVAGLPTEPQATTEGLPKESNPQAGRVMRPAPSERLSAEDDSGAPGSQPSTLNPRPLIKTLRAGEGFLSQSSKWLHFGLGAADSIERVIVHWPGGDTEEFTEIQVDHRYRLVQGSGAEQDITLPARKTKLAPSTQKLPPPSQVARIRMVELLTVPNCSYVGFDLKQRPLPTKQESSVLVNLWSSSCRPCLVELSELSRRHEEIRAKGIEIVALSVDGLGPDASETATAAHLVSNGKYPFAVGKATPGLVETFQNLHNYQFPSHRPLPLPTSFLIDQQGRLAVIYKGPLSIDELLEDVAHPDGSRLERFARSALLAGQPISHVQVERRAADRAAAHLFRLASELRRAGRAEDAATQYAEVVKLLPDFAEARNNLGATLQGLGRFDEAVRHYEEAVRRNPNLAGAHLNWGNALKDQRRFEEAVKHYQEALRIKPEFADAHYNWADALRLMGRFKDAVQHYQVAVRLNPDDAEAHYHLGDGLQALGRAEEAISHYEQVLRIKPDFAIAHGRVGTALVAVGRFKEAVAHFDDALRHNPQDVAALNNLAWLLATCPLAEVRDGDQALQLAGRLAKLQGPESFALLDTLAAAHAERGQFDKAVRWQEKAVRLAPAQQQVELRGRLELYRQGKPYRQPASGKSENESDGP